MAELLVGVWPNPLTDDIISLLKLAADPACVGIEIGPGWHTWTVHDDGELLAAAHVRRTVEGALEVHLVGGSQSERWLGILDAMLGAFARDEGLTVMRAFGRRGWVRLLTKQGWTASPLEDGGMVYERGLA